MEKTILELEKSLFKYEYMSDKEYLKDIIDDRYEELGKSGKKFYKCDVIDELNSLKTDRNIAIYNYTCEEICKSLWLVHYITLNNDIKIYRTSIWKRTKNITKIIFHQASQYKDNVDLIRF